VGDYFRHAFLERLILRFGNEVECSQGEAVDGDLGIAPGGSANHDYGGAWKIPAQDGQNLRAIHLGHEDIAENQTKGFGLHFGESDGAGRRRFHDVVRRQPSDGCADQFAVGGGIIHHQNAKRRCAHEDFVMRVET
jgi:hypothetical protein